VCQHCRTAGRDIIAALPSLQRRLEVELAPGSQASGERVSSSSPHSAPAARIAALSLRTASTVRLAQARLGPTGWTPDGADLSIPAWVDGWARAWRRRHQHHTPALVDAKPRTDKQEMPAPFAVPRPPQPTTKDPEVWRAYAAELREWARAEHDHHREEAALVAEAVERGARITLGLGAALPEVDRPDDPVGEQWAMRHGTPTEAFSLGRNVAYLVNWLDAACDDEVRHPDIGAFLLGARDLHRSATLVLEGSTGDRYVGQCPQPRRDRETGEEVPCGALLWLDAYVSVLICPRCKTETHRDHFLSLRAAQLEFWSEDQLADPRAAVR
jgi:hypothetical protein